MERALASYLSRRGLIAAMPALVVCPPAFAAAAPAGRLVFDALRMGRRIGQHRLSFRSEGVELQVLTDVEFTVGAGPLTLFHYLHHSEETWLDGAFQRLESRTRTNGAAQTLRAQRSGAGVVLESSRTGRTVAPPEAAPLSHWNLASVGKPQFNPQDGKLAHFRIARRAEPFGAPGRASTRVSFVGQNPFDDWYDDQNVWLSLRARVKDGSIIEYRRI